MYVLASGRQWAWVASPNTRCLSLDASAPPGALGQAGQLSLHWACEIGAATYVKRLVEAKAVGNCVSSKMSTLATNIITSSAAGLGDKLGAFARLAIGDSDGPAVGIPKKLRPKVAPGDELFDVAEEFEDGKGARPDERAPGTLCTHRSDALLMRASKSHSSCSHVADVHEVFESQRLHRGKWVRTRHPEAFSAEDPAHWTNRIGEPTGDADADCLTPDEWASSSQAAPEGWEWVDQIVPSLQAPGFITAVNSDKAPWVDVSGCEGLKITSKSTIPYSGFRISFGNAHPIGGKFFAFGYKADFHPPLNTMGSVYVPFNNFTDVCRCHPTAARIAFGQPPLTGASLRSSRAVLGRLDRQSHPHVPGESQLLSRCEDACQHEDHVHLGGGRRGRRDVKIFDSMRRAVTFSMVARP